IGSWIWNKAIIDQSPDHSDRTEVQAHVHVIVHLIIGGGSPLKRRTYERQEHSGRTYERADSLPDLVTVFHWCPRYNVRSNYVSHIDPPFHRIQRSNPVPPLLL